jgi:Flp pilus assembly pilin Flp
MLGTSIRAVRSLLRSEEAQDLAEYGIALGLIVAFVAVICVAIGQDINTLWANAQTQVTDVVNAE